MRLWRGGWSRYGIACSYWSGLHLPDDPVPFLTDEVSQLADMAQIGPSQKVALIGVVNPLVEAIRQRGGVCLPCDLQMKEIAWGDPVEPDMHKVLAQADSVICTGMTLSNGTFDAILAAVPLHAVQRRPFSPLSVHKQEGGPACRSSGTQNFLHTNPSLYVAFNGEHDESMDAIVHAFSPITHQISLETAIIHPFILKRAKYSHFIV